METAIASARLWSTTIRIIVMVRLAASGDPAGTMFALGLPIMSLLRLRAQRRGQDAVKWQRFVAAFLSLMLVAAVTWGTWLSLTSP